MNDKQSMGYEIIAESGELLVIDGGYSGNEDELRRLIKSAGGHVNLWLITHPHCDHHNAVIGVLTEPQGITVDRIGTSMLPDSWATGKRDKKTCLTGMDLSAHLIMCLKLRKARYFNWALCA